MPIAFVRAHTSAQSETYGTTLTPGLLANVPAGDLLQAWVGFDNTGTTTPTVSSISVPSGETATWTKVASHDSYNASAAAGCRGEMWVIVTTQEWTTGPTITLSDSVTVRCAVLKEFSGAAVTVRGTAGTATAGTSFPSVSTSGTALVTGDLVLGGATFEYGADIASDDADTLNGSWVNTAWTAAGSGYSGIQIITQHKIITATGAQTYNPTLSTNTDCGAAIVALTPPAVVIPFAAWGIPL